MKSGYHARFDLYVKLVNFTDNGRPVKVVSGTISLGRATELAGLSYDELWEALRERGLKIRVRPKNLEEARM